VRVDPCETTRYLIDTLRDNPSHLISRKWFLRSAEALPGLEKNMSRINPVTALNIDNQVAATPSQDSSAAPFKSTKRSLTGLAGWIYDRNLPFLVTSIGMIVMLLWAGSYKMTAPGAEGIIPWFLTVR